MVSGKGMGRWKGEQHPGVTVFAAHGAVGGRRAMEGVWNASTCSTRTGASGLAGYRLNNDYSQYLMELSINWFNQNRCIRFVGFHLLNNIIQFQYLWKLYINWFNKNRCVRFVGFHLLNNIISSSCGSYTSTGSTRIDVSGFSGFIFSTTLFPVLVEAIHQLVQQE